MMSDMPAERVKPCDTPFSVRAVDYVGPFFVEHARSVGKRYGASSLAQLLEWSI